jgi:hypothetical protein
MISEMHKARITTKTYPVLKISPKKDYAVFLPKRIQVL